jgi:AraC family transcriptional regulator of adaptative response/methylated-DNA-[protein]-cysteine methyltransferase
MNDYERIARLIRYLDQRHTEQPDLAALAECAGLSQFHLHRLFSAWAGITPKDFLQCLTLSHAKDLLRRGESVLGAALDAGLSGPGRLHDLCVSLEAASPGELKSGGEGWTISAGFAESPFGTCLIASGPRGICHLSFVESERAGEAADGAALAALRDEWPQARIIRDDGLAARLARRIFTPGIAVHQRSTGILPVGMNLAPLNATGRMPVPLSSPARAPLRAFVRGTAFQVRVWRALVEVPHGALVSYGRLAAALGRPTAARAVGTAVARNSIAYLIPCHRVIRETGVVGDYQWGNVRKRAMLAWETHETASEPIAHGSTLAPTSESSESRSTSSSFAVQQMLRKTRMRKSGSSNVHV